MDWCNQPQVAGFMSETIQGVGGAVPLADGYLPEVYKVSSSSARRMYTCGE
jgi:4-aminobutyrate aminotransferase-like enzyme